MWILTIIFEDEDVVLRRKPDFRGVTSRELHPRTLKGSQVKLYFTFNKSVSASCAESDVFHILDKNTLMFGIVCQT